MQGSKLASQPYCSSITTVPRREGQNPRLYFTTTTKTQSPEPASHTKLDAELEARFSTAEEPCVSVITVLITGSITDEGVNPHYGVFLGDTFTL